MRPFRFLAEAQSIVDGRTLAETARRAEAYGISVLVVTDHLARQLAPIPALATIAAATESLRIGTWVLNNGFRHPAVLAQDLASVDVLSSGRLEIGIGAGWNEPEHQAIGLAFDPVAVRVSRLAEAVTVLKGAFAADAFSFQGAHYQIANHDGQPKPVQQPHPPLFMGGGGRRLLSLAAREANTVGLAPRLVPGGRTDPRSITFAATEEKIGWVRAAAADRFDQLELNVYPSMSPIVVTDHARREATHLAERLAKRSGIRMATSDLLASPHIFIGSLNGLVEKFQMLRESLGISSIMVGGVDDLQPVVERLAGT